MANTRVFNQIFIQDPLHKVAFIRLDDLRFVHPLEILSWSKIFQDSIDYIRKKNKIIVEDFTPNTNINVLKKTDILYRNHPKHNEISDMITFLLSQFKLPRSWMREITSAIFNNFAVIEDSRSVYPIRPTLPDNENIGYSLYPKIAITTKLTESEFKRQAIEAYKELTPYLETYTPPTSRLRYKKYKNAINILLLRIQKEKLNNKSIDNNWMLVGDYLNIFTETFKAPIYIKTAKDYNTATKMLSEFKEHIIRLTTGVSKR